MDIDRYLHLKKELLEREFSHLNDMQRRAVFQAAGPVLILAGAGSGKTTVLVNRIAALLRYGAAYQAERVPSFVIETDIQFMADCAAGRAEDKERLARLIAVNPPQPWQILAITFTNKAAGELRARLEHILGEQGTQVQASTFHSACMRILRRDIERLGYSRSFVIYDADDSRRVVQDVLKEIGTDERILPPRAVLSAMGQAKDRLMTPEQLKAECGGDYRMEKIAEVYARYQKRLKAANALDFDDIITLTVRLLRENPDLAAYYQNRFRYILVDEYQDTNRSQYQLVSLLAASHGNLCVVGDDDQSIYRFRGATIENILSFEDQFKDTLVIRLEQNYRSTQHILDAANAVIRNNHGRKGKTLWTAKGEGEPVTAYRARDERDEAMYVADTVARGVAAGGRYSDYAVLYRMNAQSGALEHALVNANVPYRIIGGLRFFDRAEIKDIVAYLSVLVNPDDRLRLQRIVARPRRGIGEATVQTAVQIANTLGISLFEVFQTADSYAPLSRKAGPLAAFAGMLSELAREAESLPLPDLLDRLLEQSGYLAALREDHDAGPARLENIEELKSNMLRYQEESEEPTLAGFLEEIALYTDLDSYDPQADSMVLMTIHAAKGLEFEHVFVAGLEEGIFPGYQATGDMTQLEEERRLAYVAMTRARQRLYLLSAEQRVLFGQTSRNRLSRFVTEIPAELLLETAASSRFPAQAAKTPGAGTAGRCAGPISKTGAFDSPAPCELRPGDRVGHRVFGEGMVLSLSPMGGDTLVEVAFDRVGTKRMMANYARLKKM